MRRSEQNIEVNMIRNFAAEWKQTVNFKQIEYNDFVSKFEKVTDSYFLEKIDGVLGAFTYVNGFGAFTTVNNIKISNLPTIDEYKSILQRNKDLNHIVLIGELVGVKNNVILPFPELISVVKTSRLDRNKPLIHHYIYDVFSIDGNRSTSYKESMKFILENFQGAKRIHIPKYVYGGIEDFKKLYAKSITKRGIEGIVARLNDGKDNYKIKSSVTFDVAIIGAGKVGMKAWKKKEIPYLIVAFLDKNGIFHISSSVGTGFTMKERQDFFRYMIRNKIQETSGEVFVSPTRVIEIRGFRVRVRKAPSYSWNEKEYRYVGEKDSVILDSPSFIRERPDKSVNFRDIRLDQISIEGLVL
jgi:ATP-dependent DNA ligase